MSGTLHLCQALAGTRPDMLQLSEHLRTLIDCDGAVLLDVHQGKLIRCNRTGAAVLELLFRRCDREQIAAELSRRYEISTTAADADLCEFLATLEAQGLLRRGKDDRAKG